MLRAAGHYARSSPPEDPSDDVHVDARIFKRLQHHAVSCVKRQKMFVELNFDIVCQVGTGVASRRATRQTVRDASWRGNQHLLLRCA